MLRGAKRRRALIALCDALFSVYIRIRDGKCRLCSRLIKLQCAHLISRRYHYCRHLEDNAWALCSGCHVRYTHDPLGWDALCEAAMGPAKWAERKALAQIPCRPDYATVAFVLRLKLVAQHKELGYRGFAAQASSALAKYDKIMGGYGGTVRKA